MKYIIGIILSLFIFTANADYKKVLPISRGGTGNSAALAAGGVLLSDGTKTVVDANNFFWDNSTKRLGLGAPTPAEELEVSTAGKDASVMVTQSGDFFPGYHMKRTGGSTKTNQEWRTIIGNLGEYLINDVTNGGLSPLFIEANTPTSTLVLDSAGFVGIGTGASPASKLHIQRDVADTANIMKLQNETAAGDVSVFWRNSTQNWAMGLDGSDSSKFKISLATTVGTNDVITLDGSQFVGIGTTSPVEKLHVNVTGASSEPRIEISNGGNGKSVINFSETTTSYWHVGIDSALGNNFHISPNASLGSPSISITSAGVINIPNLTASSDVQTDGSKNLISVSDKTMKNHISNIEDGALERIKLLKPVYYSWKNDSSDAKQLGFYAQDVSPVIPQAAPYDIDSGLYGFNGRAIVANLVKALQESDAKIEKQAELISILQKQKQNISNLEDRISKLEN